MQRTLIIRTYGDANLAKTVAHSFENPELKRLRAELGVRNFGSDQECIKKMRELPKKYPIRKRNPVAEKLLVLYAFVWVLLKS